MRNSGCGTVKAVTGLRRIISRRKKKTREIRIRGAKQDYLVRIGVDQMRTSQVPQLKIIHLKMNK